ncbi:hypothetical protein CBS101457_006746 [Exobasidium rhododendri]|nr:hypothetical protein CBS101457_006746 [Exobasidium rhododendri]
MSAATPVIAALSAVSASASQSATASASAIPNAEEQERDSSLALFLVLLLLIGSFWTSYYLKVKKITAVHETIVGLFAGMFVGAALRIGPGEEVQKMLSFSNTIMLNVLLPPIILASGYDLRQENFFRNFGTILTFAFAGTFISAIVVGVIVYLWSLLHLESLSLSLLECLIFGSTLSATDPVTILAIFNTYKVDPQLYSVIFGESILNDAVSIVMFDVLTTFRGKAISIASLFHGLGLFLFVFTFSMALGVAFGLVCSLMLKHSRLSSYPPLESCLVTLVAYTSYFFSNGVTMSGIVSLLFCGITLKHYAYHNMSRRTQRATRYIFQTLANLSENFIFIYLGLSLFTQETLVYKPLFILVTVAAVVLSRYSAVFPIAAFVNAVKRTKMRRRSKRAGPGNLRDIQKSDEELPREYQVMLFWAGLRGAVGFALSAGIEGSNAPALQTTVLVTVVLTVIVFGGTTAQMLDILGIRTGVEDDEGDSTDEEEEAEIAAMRLKSMRKRRRIAAGYGVGRNSRATSGETRSLYRDVEEPRTAPASIAQSGFTKNQPYVQDDEEDDDDRRSSTSSTEVLPLQHGGSSSSSIYPSDDPLISPSTRAVKEFAGGSEEDNSVRKFLDRAGLIMRDGRWFSTLDQRYLTPLFTNSVASRKHEERKAMRRSEVALAAADTGPSSTMNSSRGGSSRNSFQFEGGVGGMTTFDERDADILDEEEEDEENEFVRSLDGNSTSHSAFGGPPPVRRPSSRATSEEGATASRSKKSSSRSGSGSGSGSSSNNNNNNTNTSGSRFTGAFAPFSQDNRTAGSSFDHGKQRKSDDLGPL